MQKKTKTTTITQLQKLRYQMSPLGESIKTSSSHHHYHQLQALQRVEYDSTIAKGKSVIPSCSSPLPPPSPLPPLIIRATGKWWEWEKDVIKLIKWGLRNSKHSRQDRGEGGEEVY
jgi:hypothetical protein